MTRAPVLWTIRPVAGPDDPRWQGRTIWREIVVSAADPGEAAYIAERAADDPAAPAIGNESESRRHGFADEKLYAIRRIPPDEAGAYASYTNKTGMVMAVPLAGEA